MIETLSHPAQSAEFLSRRHDGELTEAEAAAFEAHRRECRECEASVAEFERALAAYRSAPVSPHATDLSARILRKIRAASPSRRPFGVKFGIDVRWAGAIAAALLVVIIGAPVFSGRRAAPSLPPAPPAPASAPIPAYVLEAEEERPGPKRAEALRQAPAPEAPAKSAAAKPDADDAAKTTDLLERRDGARENATHRDEVAATGPANADKSDQAAAAQEPPAPAAPRPAELFAAAPPAHEADGSDKKEVSPSLGARRRSASAPAGGEAGGGVDEPAAIEVRLRIQPADGGGEPPEVAETPSDDRLTALRGKKYLLVVEPAGRVVSVEEQPAGQKLGKDAKQKAAQGDAEDAQRAARMRALAESIMRELIFQPGDRSRRLVVSVQ